MLPPALDGSSNQFDSRDNNAWLSAFSMGGPTGRAAEEQLRRVLVAGLRRILSSRGVGTDLCEDVAQDALLRIRQRLADFRGESRFTTWAMSIATRLAFDELRHKRWKDVSFEALTADANLAFAFDARSGLSDEKKILRDRVLSALRDVLETKLTPKQRSVLVAELNGMPHAEIALAVGTSRNALYKLAHDARKSVKSHLEAAGLSASDVLWIFE